MEEQDVDAVERSFSQSTHREASRRVATTVLDEVLSGGAALEPCAEPTVDSLMRLLSKPLFPWKADVLGVCRVIASESRTWERTQRRSTERDRFDSLVKMEIRVRSRMIDELDSIRGSMEDSDPEVRALAYAVLAELARNTADIERLERKFASEPDELAQATLGEAIVRGGMVIGSDESIQRAVAWALDHVVTSNGALRLRVLRVLDALDDPEVLPPADGQLGTESATARWPAEEL